MIPWTTCTRRLEFDAGHRVPLHESKCRTPHGHRYVVDITCIAPTLTPEGFVVDFGIVKEVVGGWIDHNLDHTMIFQWSDEMMRDFSIRTERRTGMRDFFHMDEPPTAENLAKLLYEQATYLLKQRQSELKVLKVVVHETPNCSATYMEIEDDE